MRDEGLAMITARFVFMNSVTKRSTANTKTASTGATKPRDGYA